MAVTVVAALLLLAAAAHGQYPSTQYPSTSSTQVCNNILQPKHSVFKMNVSGMPRPFNCAGEGDTSSCCEWQCCLKFDLNTCLVTQGSTSPTSSTTYSLGAGGLTANPTIYGSQSASSTGAAPSGNLSSALTPASQAIAGWHGSCFLSRPSLSTSREQEAPCDVRTLQQ